MLRVWAGAPRPPLAITPSHFGQRALVAGESSGESVAVSVSLSLFPQLTSGARYSVSLYTGEALRVVAPLGFYSFDVTPSIFLFIQIYLNLQSTSNSYNFLTISPTELILFALCSLK